MYGSRRREARAINSRNLQWSETDFADVDYVAARAMSGSPLGSSLERLKVGMDRSAYGSHGPLSVVLRSFQAWENSSSLACRRQPISGFFRYVSRLIP
jgi:hypothetical protein